MATQTVGRGLSPADLTRIRETLAAGRRPKVVFTRSAGQIAGQVGQVVELTDPAGSDEWVVVRFGRDELPFSPADLAVPPRAVARKVAQVPEQQPARRGGPAVAGSPEPVDGRSVDDEPVRAEPVKEQPMPPSPTPAATKPVSARAAKAAAAPVVAAPVADADVPRPAPVKDVPVKDVPEAPVVAAAVPAKPRKAARPKPTPNLTVTVTYADGDWMVSATQGSRVLAKPYVVRPAEALRMVALLDVPGVHEAVEEIVSSARDEAQKQAERLRAELAEVESRLAELRETP
jgi:hypothetical protein